MRIRLKAISKIALHAPHMCGVKRSRLPHITVDGPWRPRRDSNTRPLAPQASALSTELRGRGPASQPASGGEGGIRTHGRGFNPYKRLAGAPVRPLRHLPLFLLRRRERDSNPRWVAPQRFSRPPPSTTRPSLQAEPLPDRACGFYHAGRASSKMGRQRRCCLSHGSPRRAAHPLPSADAPHRWAGADPGKDPPLGERWARMA